MRHTTILHALTPLAVTVGLLTLGPASAAVADGSPGVFQTIPGTITPKKARESIPYTPAADQFTAGSDGRIGLSLTVSADGGTLDPGRPSVLTGATKLSVRALPDILGTKDGYALASLAPGVPYSVVVQGEGNTVGKYTLSLALAGDVDGDLSVSQADLGVIDGLLGVRFGHAGYQAAADLDRDGVISKSDLRRAKDNLGAAEGGAGNDNPLETFLPDGALTLSGVDEHATNPLDAELTFGLAGADFSIADPSETRVTVNGIPVPATQLTLAAGSVKVTGALVDGANAIGFHSYDTIGRPLYLHKTVWAGSRDLTVSVVGEDGAPFLHPTNLTLSLVDDVTVTQVAQTATGSAVFHHVPVRTVLVKATGGEFSGITGAVGNEGISTLVMHGFKPASPINNNDFADGTAQGWDVGGAPVTVGPHVEGAGPVVGAKVSKLARPAPQKRTNTGPVTPLGSLPPKPGAVTPLASVVDNDLTLNTGGEGPQSISRTFKTDPDVVGVRVRYRFVTSEVPGGYFGTKYNDYFSVGVRSATKGGSQQEANSMNGLGLGSFDASGSTAWREAVLPTDKKGDTIQVDLTVANVADGLLDSQVVVDFVEEIRERVIPTLTWDSTTGGLKLAYTVESANPLTQEAQIEVFFASGAGYENRLGAAIFTRTVPAGTAPGVQTPVNVPGSTLADDPAGTTHLIAASSPSAVGPIPDVRVDFGANADSSVVPATMIDIVKDGLRAAGAAQATITSTARTPADQARIMFGNLTNPAHTIAQNTATQHGIYAAAGDAVIDVFTAQTAGQTPAQIQANAPAIKQAMKDEIEAQGPQHVSLHTADPAVISVVDVGLSAFNATNGPIFKSAVTPRLSRLLDENGCYHLERTL